MRAEEAWAAGTKRSRCLAASLLSFFALPAAPAKTAKKPVTDDFHGTKVVDEYRWLEDFADPAVRARFEAVTQDNCRAIADLHNSTSAAQRRLAITALKNYEDDFRALLPAPR